MDKSEILKWLEETDTTVLNQLWLHADQIRHQTVGDEVHLRGLIEISSFCSRQCLYCGLRASRHITRYRMTADEIWGSVEKSVAFGYGTVVLQAGEDASLTREFVGNLVRKIKNETDLAVTLSLGEQPKEILEYWKSAGADRYLLRIETTDEKLLNRIHPGKPHGSRMETIYRLRELGYQVGSGIMVGIPGQTYEIIAQDLGWFHEMDLDMIGIGPYLAHPDTPLAAETIVNQRQIPSTEIVTHKVVALTRLLCPEANIPATTALATINKDNGREQALARGANVVMPNLTPAKYRKFYEIYPNKACVSETEELCQGCITARIVSLGRQIGIGPGHRKHTTLRSI